MKFSTLLILSVSSIFIQNCGGGNSADNKIC